MLYQGITLSLIIVEGILILISFRFLQRINLVSKDFATIFGNAKGEISYLFNNLKELVILSSKKEHHLLHMTLHLEKIEMCIQTVLDELKTQERDHSLRH